jgi:predicted ATPase
MSLRQAKFDDHWRHVYSRTYKTRFTEIRFNNLGCLANTTIAFSGGLNAIVGANGVGKSTLAAGITQLLSEDPNTVEDAFRSRLAGSSLDGTAYDNNTQLNLSVTDAAPGQRVLNGDKFTGNFAWLDPSSVAGRYVDQFHKDKNFKDLLDQVTPLKLEADELKMASYLVGKKYSDIDIFEISDYAGLDRFPYLRASSAGVSYNSEGMGRGELSLLLTYWTLRDMPKDSILVLEEPETHVSPRSQDCLMNIIAKFCDEKAIWVIVTTHSPTVIRRIPKEHIKLLLRDAGPAAPIASPSKLDIALLLGGGVAYSGVLLVEDEGAKQFLLPILEKLDPELMRQFEVVAAGSVTNISSLLKTMPETRSWLTLIGIYDGDMRQEIGGDDFLWTFEFLPGAVAPEHLLIALAENEPNFANVLATELQMDAAQVQLALNHVAGVDFHDYFGGFAAGLNVEPSLVRRAFVRIWLQDPASLALAEGFVRSVRESVRE